MDGRLLKVEEPCGVSCEQCAINPCSLGCAGPLPLPADGVRFTWDGTIWEGTSRTCATGNHCDHQRGACAPPGKYVATMCAVHNVADAGSNPICTGILTQKCLEVEFDYPSATPVEQKLE
jgi:hypothetical protein